VHVRAIKCTYQESAMKIYKGKWQPDETALVTRCRGFTFTLTADGRNYVLREANSPSVISRAPNKKVIHQDLALWLNSYDAH